MTYEFDSIEELHERVLPALNTRISELNELGYNDIDEKDIWEYLVSSKWKIANYLTLSDIVGDILNVDYSKVIEYKNNKL